MSTALRLGLSRSCRAMATTATVTVVGADPARTADLGLDEIRRLEAIELEMPAGTAGVAEAAGGYAAKSAGKPAARSTAGAVNSRKGRARRPQWKR